MNVKELRVAQKMTQETLAHAAGVKLSTLQKIEREAVLPPGTSVEVAVRLAHTLGVSVEDLAQIP